MEKVVIEVCCGSVDDVVRAVRRPDSSVESGLGLLLPYCRIEHRNPSYGGGLLPPDQVA